MKLKYTFDSVDMGEEIIAVPVGEGSIPVHGVLKLNKEGCEILDLLKTDTTEEQIVSALTAKYENERDQLAGYVHGVVETLQNANLLDE